MIEQIGRMKAKAGHTVQVQLVEQRIRRNGLGQIDFEHFVQPGNAESQRRREVHARLGMKSLALADVDRCTAE
jgi:hypothetical protein